jgi:hypothetical protein
VSPRKITSFSRSTAAAFASLCAVEQIRQRSVDGLFLCSKATRLLRGVKKFHHRLQGLQPLAFWQGYFGI